MLEASVFEYSSEAPGHPANAICYHAKNGLGWIPDRYLEFKILYLLRVYIALSYIVSSNIHNM